MSPLDAYEETVKKNTNYCWKRCRCTVGKEPDAQVFAEEHTVLATLNSSEAKAKGWELYYFDESGFSLHPVVPYAWQPKGQTIRIPSTASPRLNVLGFFSKTQPAFFSRPKNSQ
ncbi:MAG: transposase [Moraxellaceae bacterium]|nr:transposase [Moraxellaceae bacterium]